MKPIPKAMLIHSAEAYKETKGDWGPSGLTPLGKLERIRIVTSSKVVRDKNNKEVQLSALLFYDCRNSRGGTDVLKEDNIVDFQGDKYRIVAADPLSDAKRLHHYEVGMVKYAGDS